MATSAMEVTSGRYICGSDVCAELGRELKLLSVKKVFILGGERALKAVLPRIEPCLAEEGISYVTACFKGYCTYEQARKYADEIRAAGCGCVVGIGGGRCIDTGKIAADMAAVPLGTIPTQAATCVSCTNMAIVYEESGRYIGPFYPQLPIQFTLADYSVMCQAPVRYIASGIVDSMAKYPELHFSQRGTYDCGAVDDAALQGAYGMAANTWNTLMTNGLQAYEDNRRGTATNRYTAVINTNLVTTGVISGLARGSKQLAIAHAVYNFSTFLFPEAWRSYLHGEIVSVGIVLQEYYNRAPEAELSQYIGLAKSLGVPVCLRDIGVQGTGGELDALCGEILKKYSDFSAEDGRRLRSELERVVQL